MICNMQSLLLKSMLSNDQTAHTRTHSESREKEREFINETKAYWHRCNHDYYIANRATVTSSAHIFTTWNHILSRMLNTVSIL